MAIKSSGGNLGGGVTQSPLLKSKAGQLGLGILTGNISSIGQGAAAMAGGSGGSNIYNMASSGGSPESSESQNNGGGYSLGLDMSQFQPDKMGAINRRYMGYGQ